jgi:hypothetical protein
VTFPKLPSPLIMVSTVLGHVLWSHKFPSLLHVSHELRIHDGA